MRMVDDRSEQAATAWQVTDESDLLRAHADIDELLKVAARGDHAECSVLGIDQFDGGLDDSLEHNREIQVLDDRLVGLEQGAEPTLGDQHLTRSQHQVVECLVEVPARVIREVE